MLSKLIKHEWRSFWKIPAFVSLFLAIFTIFGVFVLHAKIWEIDNPIVSALGIFILLFYYISLFVIFFVTLLYAALRFYKNIYTDEGYLMHTLPVTQKSLIFSKLVVSYAWTIITGLVMACSIFALLCALLSATGEFASFWEAMAELFQNIPRLVSEYGHEFKEIFGIGIIPLFIVTVLSFILGPLSGILMIYTAISLGQLFQKHKVFGSIISYIGIYVFLQILNSVVTAPLMFSSALTEQFTAFGAVMYFSFGETIVLIIVFFFLTEWIMKKKLNLD